MGRRQSLEPCFSVVLCRYLGSLPAGHPRALSRSVNAAQRCLPRDGRSAVHAGGHEIPAPPPRPVTTERRGSSSDAAELLRITRSEPSRAALVGWIEAQRAIDLGMTTLLRRNSVHFSRVSAPSQIRTAVPETVTMSMLPPPMSIVS